MTGRRIAEEPAHACCYDGDAFELPYFAAPSVRRASRPPHSALSACFPLARRTVALPAAARFSFFVGL